MSNVSCVCSVMYPSVIKENNIVLNTHLVVWVFRGCVVKKFIERIRLVFDKVLEHC